MIDRKIESLKTCMSDESQDTEEIKRTLEQLHHERITLPTNYGEEPSSRDASLLLALLHRPSLGHLDLAGSGGKWDDFEGTPASPLSCASTTAAFSDDAVDLESDSHVEVMELAERESTMLELQDGYAAVEHAGTPTTKVTRVPSTSGHGEPKPVSLVGASAAQESGFGSSRGHQTTSNGNIQLEVELPSAAAAHVANGAQLMVHQERGLTKIEIIPSEPGVPTIFIPVSGGQSSTAEHKHLLQARAPAAPARHKSAKRKHAAAMLSDEEMIASLAGCASMPTAPAGTAPAMASMSDNDLVAALAADAIQASQPGVIVRDTSSGMSDEELAAALAGCAQETQAAPLTQEIEPWGDASTCNYDDVPHDDGGLGLALFDSSE